MLALQHRDSRPISELAAPASRDRERSGAFSGLRFLRGQTLRIRNANQRLYDQEAQTQSVSQSLLQIS